MLPLAFVVLAGVWFLVRGSGRPTRSPAPLTRADEHEPRSAMPSERVATTPGATPDGSAPDGARTRSFSVNGTIVEGATRAPLAGAEVVLVGPHGPARARADGAGRFAFALDPARWTAGELVGATATLGDARPRVVFVGQIMLADRIELIGRVRLALRGQLVTPEGAPAELGDGLGASAFAEGPSFAGLAALDEQSRFELEAWVERPPPAFRLVFGRGAATVFAADVGTAELTAPAGAAIVVAGAALEVVVRDEAGAPLPGVALRVRSLPLERGAELLTGVSGADGRERFQLLPGAFEVAAGMEGRASSVQGAELTAAGATLEFRLRALGSAERIAGRVVDGRGEPVVGAYVSAAPRSSDPELGVVGSVGVNTDGTGAFELAVASEAPLEVIAYEESLGFSDTLVARTGQRDLLLTIEPQGRVALEVELAPSLGDSLSGDELEWILLDERAASEGSGTFAGAGIVLEPVRAGEFELLLGAPALGALGQAHVTVRAGEESGVLVRLEPVGRVRGLLVRGGRPGAGLALELEGAALPRGAGRWARGTSDATGAFELLLGTAAEAELVLRTEAGELARFPVVSGDVGVLLVPE